MDSVDTSSPIDPEMVASSLPALGWARVLLFMKQHGIVAGLCLLMLYELGTVAALQAQMCGV
jgi:hypothetical protein